MIFLLCQEAGVKNLPLPIFHCQLIALIIFLNDKWKMKNLCVTIITMTATGHAIIGTVIAAKIANPAIGIPLAFLSHIVADSFPHWDTATNSATKGKHRVLLETFFDVFASFALSYLLIYFIFPQTNVTYAFFMIISAQALDWLMAPYYFFNSQFFIFKNTYNFQKLFDHRLDKPWGIINQIAVLILLISLAKAI